MMCRRGVHRCLAELQRDPEDRGQRAARGETLRRAGELHAQFHYGLFDELAAEGITVLLDRFQRAAARTWVNASPHDFLVPLGNLRK